MKNLRLLGLFLLIFSCQSANKEKERPPENMDTREVDLKLVDFVSYKNNPVFTGTGTDTWDKHIRERGFILFEDSVYHMWYTGYNKDRSDRMHLGYASSKDGILWNRYTGNPIYSERWVEDMFVLKLDNTYHMFAEGRNDIAHYLTSSDPIHWTDQGDLDIRYTNGSPLSEGPFGTPTIWKENDKWYLFYERNDLGIWLAISEDLNIWTNVQDEPVLAMGPESYDSFGLAVNQIVMHVGIYYAFYHGTALKDWSEWTTNVATSQDLIHWKKYPGNPILEENKSSGILVWDETEYRMYTMHNEVNLHFPAQPK